MDLPIDYNKASWQERRAAREEYTVLQKGRCFYCGEMLDDDVSLEVRSKTLNMGLFPENFLKYPVHLHHCHKTGKTIGAVHAKCNGVLWQYHGE